MKSVRVTKVMLLQEQVALAEVVRIGLCACLSTVIAQQTKMIGGDQATALAAIRATLDSTVASLKAHGKDAIGQPVEITGLVRPQLNKLLDVVFREAQRRLSTTAH